MTEKKPNYKTEQGRKLFRIKVMFAAANLFLEKGYTQTPIREISERAEVNISSLNQHFGTKENILCELVEYVLEGQFTATTNLLKDKTDDKILFYAAETTLQLYMAESSEHIRDLYAAAYSMPKSSAIIQQMITDKLKVIFGEVLPDLDTKDFYKLEIASGGIMRGFMTIPCNMWFTIEQKVASFLETAFRVFCVPNEKTQEAIEFVSTFGFAQIARQTIDDMLTKLNRMEAKL